MCDPIAPHTDLSVEVLAVLHQSSWYLLELATRASPRSAAEPTAARRGARRGENAPPLAAGIPQTEPRIILGQKIKKK